MSNLIPLEQAAQMLGMSVDRLNELRSNKKVFGYRDGKSWKFKMDELQRLADDLEIKIGQAGGAGKAKDKDSGDFQLSDSSAGDALLLDDSDDLVLDDSADSIELKRPKTSAGNKKTIDDDDDLLSFGDSSIDLAAESSKKLKAGAADLDDKASSSTGKLLAGGNSDDDLLLIDDSVESGSGNDSVELSSDYDDSDLVLEDSDSSAELDLAKPAKGNAKGNGKGKVNLSASESGVSLSDDALELGGSDVDEFQLMADEDNDIISLSDSADLDAATLMQEDDFNLTPMEPGDGDESSGSQVIALEDSDLFAEESAETMLGQQAFDNTSATTAEPDFQQNFSPTSGPAPVAGVVEVPFTMWQVFGLAASFIPLAIGGMVAYDLARNLWMPKDQVVSSGPLQFFLWLVGQG